MAKLDLPYVKWRNGRPRFEPSPRERLLGFIAQDLKTEAGEWFSFEQAKEFADAKLKDIHAARASGRKVKAQAPGKPRTVEELLADWLQHFRVIVARGDRSKAALVRYEKAARAITYRPETREDAAKRRQREQAAEILGVALPTRPKEPMATSLVAAVGAPELRAFFDYAREKRGHNMAVAMINALSAAFTWGRESTVWRLGANPRLGMEFERPEGRIVYYSFEEFSAMVAAADELGLSSVGDCFYLGLFTGQRQTDRLAMKDEGLIDGRRHLVQSKTGEFVKIKEAPQLAARLAAAKARVAAIKLKFGTRPDEIVVFEQTGLPYNGDTYRGKVAEVRVHAAKKLPSLADKHDQDLRDTFVTVTYRAMNRVGRVDLKAIADISGHSHQSIETIIKHYLGRDEFAADQAMDILAKFIGQEVAK